MCHASRVLAPLLLCGLLVPGIARAQANWKQDYFDAISGIKGKGSGAESNSIGLIEHALAGHETSKCKPIDPRGTVFCPDHFLAYLYQQRYEREKASADGTKAREHRDAAAKCDDVCSESYQAKTGEEWAALVTRVNETEGKLKGQEDEARNQLIRTRCEQALAFIGERAPLPGGCRGGLPASPSALKALAAELDSLPATLSQAWLQQWRDLDGTPSARPAEADLKNLDAWKKFLLDKDKTQREQSWARHRKELTDAERGAQGVRSDAEALAATPTTLRRVNDFPATALEAATALADALAKAASTPAAWPAASTEPGPAWHDFFADAKELTSLKTALDEQTTRCTKALSAARNWARTALQELASERASCQSLAELLESPAVRVAALASFCGRIESDAALAAGSSGDTSLPAALTVLGRFAVDLEAGRPSFRYGPQLKAYATQLGNQKDGPAIPAGTRIQWRDARERLQTAERGTTELAQALQSAWGVILLLEEGISFRWRDALRAADDLRGAVGAVCGAEMSAEVERVKRVVTGKLFSDPDAEPALQALRSRIERIVGTQGCGLADAREQRTLRAQELASLRQNVATVRGWMAEVGQAEGSVARLRTRIEALQPRSAPADAATALGMPSCGESLPECVNTFKGILVSASGAPGAMDSGDFVTCCVGAALAAVAQRLDDGRPRDAADIVNAAKALCGRDDKYLDYFEKYVRFKETGHAEETQLKLGFDARFEERL